MSLREGSGLFPIVPKRGGDDDAVMTDELNDRNASPDASPDDDAPPRSAGAGDNEGTAPQGDEAAGASEDTTEGPATPGASPSQDAPPAPPPGSGGAAASSPAYQPPPPPLHHRLMRRPEGKVIAGVCSGLGAYTGTDPVLWRIGFVVLTLAGGSGILAYIVAWLVMPEARPGEPLPDRATPDAQKAGQWIAIGAIALGALLIFRGVFDIHGGWFWGLLLIGIGVAIWGRDLSGGRPGPNRPTYPTGRTTQSWPATSSTSHTPATPPAASPTPPPAGSAGSGESSFWTAPTASLPPRPTIPPMPPPIRREPSILGRVVVGAGALAIGIALLLDNVNVLRVTPKGMFAVLLAIVGIGLLIGSRWGRARWLIFPGVVLAFLLAVATIIPFSAKGGWGDIAWRPSSLRMLQTTCREASPGAPCYEHWAGQAVLDLTDVNFGGRERNLDVRLGFGELLVIVPEDVTVDATAHIQGGEINLFGENSEGWDISQTTRSNVKDGDGPLRLETNVTFGEITVRHGDRRDAEDLLGSRRNFDFRMGSRRFFRSSEGG